METYELELELGGILYNVEIDLEEGYVCGVESVEVYDGEGNSFHIDMTYEQMNQFFERYEDALNDAYQADKVARAEQAAEERWELRTGR